MNGIDVLKSSLSGSRKMIEWVISDLSDADLLVRPVPEANHLAWQLGHLIVAEKHLVLEQLPSATFPELPAGFAESYTKETSQSDDPGKFHSKAQYLELLGKMREATLSELAKLSDADLDRPTLGNMAAFCPTLGAIFGMVSDHITMHMGQASVVRRKLGKPVLF